MKNNFKTTIPYLICAILIFLLYTKWDQPVKIVRTEPIEVAAKIVKAFEDKNGVKHTVIEKNSNTITHSALEDPTIVAGFVDTASTALKIAKSQIDQITKAYFTAVGENLKLEKRNDSLEGQVFEYRGKYLWAQFNPKKSEEFPNGKFSYRYNGDFNVVDYTKRTKLLGLTVSKKEFTDFYLSDTAAYLTGNIKRLTFEKFHKNKSIQLGAFSQYDLQRNIFGYGPSVRIEKGPFDVSINQVYWPIEKNWSTLFNAHFTIKSF